MKLTWKDIFTTITAAVVAVALFAKLRNYDWILIGSWRTAIGSIGFLGFLLATFDEEDFTHFNAWGLVEWTLALAAAGLFAAGMVWATKVWFVLMAADILAIWLTSISRHLLSHEGSEPRGLARTM